MQETKQRYENLDILRALAALAVFGYHLLGHLGIGVNGGWGDVLKMPFIAGWIGVDLFLVISGCVISLNIFSSCNRGDWSGRSFMFQRLARIAPLHWLTLLLAASLLSLNIPLEQGSSLAASLGFFHNLHFDWYGRFNGPSWSVALEMQFYLLMALLAVRLHKVNRYQVLILGFAVSMFWKFGVMASFDFQVDLSNSVEVRKLVILITQLPAVLDQFAVGYFVARTLTDGRGKSSQIAEHVQCRLATRLLLLVALFLCVLYFSFWYAAVFPEMSSSYEAWIYVFIRALFGWVFGALIWAVCTLPIVRSSRPLRWLGERSYGIYLWHTLVIVGLTKFPPVHPLTFAGLAVVGTIALASLSWTLLEKPVVIWAKSKLKL
jgi:peptidoglycan/LPS O-acetylase OafA/YrhL